MARKKQLIIPLFIPFSGCRHLCVFCNQAGITGEKKVPTATEITAKIEAYLETWERTEKRNRVQEGKKRRRREAAFYGGSFTALDAEAQAELLRPAYDFVLSGRLDALRVSTRPDAISLSIVELLKRFSVETIELGVQSMDPAVLRLSGRGHTKEDTVAACRLLKEHGFTVGLQVMPGLPGDTLASIVETAKEVSGLEPDFVRVYPTLVLKSTPLEKSYQRGEYKAWPLEQMIEACTEIAKIFKDGDIPVIRMGLAHTAELESRVIAGPYHPALKDLIETKIGHGA